jgi:hypothetical protein
VGGGFVFGGVMKCKDCRYFKITESEWSAYLYEYLDREKDQFGGEIMPEAKFKTKSAKCKLGAYSNWTTIPCVVECPAYEEDS